MRVLPALIVLLIAPLAHAAELPAEALRTITDAASALASEDSAAFLDQFDRDMPGYAALRANVEALAGASQPISTIESVTSDGDAQKQTVQLDWLLAINDKDHSGIRKETRRSIVKCRLELRGKRWKIVALEPVDFFRP